MEISKEPMDAESGFVTPAERDFVEACTPASIESQSSHNADGSFDDVVPSPHLLEEPAKEDLFGKSSQSKIQIQLDRVTRRTQSSRSERYQQM